MAAVSNVTMGDAQKHSILDSLFPVLLPEDEALFMPEAEFQALIKREIVKIRQPNLGELQAEIDTIETADKDIRWASKCRQFEAASFYCS
jgi:hypothetical protein